MAVANNGSMVSEKNERKLRAHKKSRRGCPNCKARKVKCDESKPSCNKCNVYGIFCDYHAQGAELQSSARGVGTLGVLQDPSFSQTQMVLGIINKSARTPSSRSSPSSSSSFQEGYTFSKDDLQVMYRYHTRTVSSLGSTPSRQAYQQLYSKLAYSHVFLLHTILTLTLVHDQYLGFGSRLGNAASIAFHWSQAAALLNERLSAGVEPSERDALWACAILLGALSFSAIEANTPESAWPLDPNASLEWLRMTEGKKEIWKITEPLREDSIFRSVGSDTLSYASPNSASLSGLQQLPTTLFKLCKFDELSLHQNNPYYGPASIIAQTEDIDCTQENACRFLSFFNCMNDEYKRLLNQKDPAAMLILGYWYSKICHARQWCTWRRAYLESQAICKYLIQHYEDNDDILLAARDIQTRCAAEKPWSHPSVKHANIRTIRPLTT